MSENLHDIDKLFKDSIEGHEEMPSDKVWDAIDNNLDKTNVIQIKRKYNNLKRLAVALLLLLLGTVVYEIQSKKTGKQELVKNNGKDSKEIINNNTKEQTNVADEKTKKNNEENKLNGSENITDTGSAKSGNDEVNNAGKDIVNNTGKDAANKIGKDQENAEGKDAANNTIKDAGKNALNHPVQQDKDNAGEKIANNLHRNLNADKTRIKIKNSKPAIENGNDVANDKTAEQLGNKTAIKKSSSHKTNIRIKNGTVDEGLNTAENNAAKNAADKSIASTKTNELKALQNDKAERITTTQKNVQFNFSEKRISPDANVNNAVAKNNKSSKPFHFNVTAFYSPQFGSNKLKEEHHDPTAPPPPGGSREEIKKDEPHERSSSLGVLVQVPVGKGWSIQTGVTLTNKKISIEPKKIFAKLDNDGKLKYRFDCSSGYTYISTKTVTSPAAVGDSVNVTASSNSLQYVGIPLLASYTFSLGKFSIIPTAGTGINFLTKQRIETELVQGTTKEKQTINTIQGLKKTYFNAFAGVSLEYNVSKRVAVNVTPSGKFALSSINKDAAVKSYPNSFGVAAGIKIKF